MVDDRRLEVLRVIVEDYVNTSEPVGSRALVERHRLAVSPATVRNDMSVLEEEGYIVQPHTSAGRIPTDKGYRLFVDQLSTVRPLSHAQRRAIHAFLDQAVGLDDVMVSTVRLLAQMTRQVAVVQYPSLTQSRVRHIEIVALGGGRLLLVVIADTGRVEQRIVSTGVELDGDTVNRLQSRLRGLTSGKRFAEVADSVSEFRTELDEADHAAGVVVSAVVATLLDTVVEHHEERVLAGGTANLTRAGGDFSAALQPVLEALEEQMVLLRLLGEQASEPEAVTVTIGHENDVEPLSSTSVVSTGYGSSGAAIGRLGVVGPTRMDYAGTMGAVRAVARYLGRIVEH